MGRKKCLVTVGRYQSAKIKDERDEGKLKWYDVGLRE
jgi:hypothetical protein